MMGKIEDMIDKLDPDDAEEVRAAQDTFRLVAINKKLRASNAKLLATHEPDRLGPSFLDWIADRLVLVHGEPKDSDFVIALRRRAELARSAIAEARNLTMTMPGPGAKDSDRDNG